MIRVYKYGIKPPADFGDDCLDELRRMNTFWNKLVELDRERETAFRNLCRSWSPEYATAMDRIDALKPPIDDLYEEIRATRIKNRSKELTEEIKARKDELLGERKALWETCKAIQKKLPKDMQLHLVEKYKADCKLARQQSGLYWGNYNAVIESFETAKSRTIKEGGRLHFKPFDGTGRFVNQIQGGMTVVDLFMGAKSQAKCSASVLRQSRGGTPHHAFMFTAFTGHDAEGKRFRRELTVDLAYHRPIPADGSIKSIEVVRDIIDGREKWYACFTVSLPDVEVDHPNRNIAGVNLGWRQIASALRIAVIVDDKNQKREYFLPAPVVHKFHHAETIQAQADEAENEMLAWLREIYQAATQAPQAWKETAQGILRNRPARDSYAKLLTEWESVSDLIEGFEEYKAWYKANQKLHRHYTGTRRRAIAWRDDIYRNIAKEIAENYAVIAITDMPLSQMSRTKGNDGLGIDNALPEAARRNRVIAGVYTLKEWIDKQATKTGAVVEKITDKVTMTCNKCGTIAEKRVGSAQYFTCKGCESEVEVDVNAAINCRKLASGDGAPKKGPRKATKYQRVRESMQTKNDSARKIADNAKAPA
jgi:hypothetical protein